MWRSDSAPPAAFTRIRWWCSLRFQVAATLAILAVFMVSVFGLLTARSVLDSSREQQRQRATAAVQSATAGYTFGGQVNSDVSILSEGVPKVLTQALQDDSIATWDDGRYMWAAGRLSDGKVLSVRLSDAPLLARWNQLRVEILQIAIAVAVTASLIGWAIALQLTGRLRRAARAAQLISSGDLNERAFTSGRDEIAALARAVDTMTATLVKRIDRERAWTADAAHELRTPLTALVSAVELLDDGTDAQRVRQLVGRLRHLVEDLMRLARLEDGSPVAPLETVDLGGLVCEVIGDLADTPGLRLTVDAPAEVRVVADGARRALRNLIANAVRHGRPPIEVAVSGATAVITDHGPGYPRELLSTGPRRFQPYGPAGRTGLGLTIAVRELQAMHATLALTNGPSGASATVEFVIDAE